MPPIPCECGCGTQIAPLTTTGQPARFAHGHNLSGMNTRFKKDQPSWNKAGEAPWARKPLSEERKRALMEGRRRYVESLPKVCTVEGCERPVRQRGYCDMHYMRWRKHGDPLFEIDRSGPNNPFYGRTHSEETRRQFAKKHIGPLNHGWKGGVGTAPYGPEFTKKFKALIRERDNYTCQECRRRWEPSERQFHVHHIDFSKDNNDPSNLATVCPQCHRRIHPQHGGR